MEKFVPYEKLSKKEKRRLDRAKRQTWGDLNPVTRKPVNSRAYNRKRAQKQWASALFQTVKEGIFRCIPHSHSCSLRSVHGYRPIRALPATAFTAGSYEAVCWSFRGASFWKLSRFYTIKMVKIML